MEFKYKAKKNLNEIVEGRIEGPGMEQVLEDLQRKGLIPVSVEPLEPAVAAPVRGGRFGLKQLVLFTQKLHSLINTRVELLNALRLIEQGSENATEKDFLQDMIKNIKEGVPFSKCLIRYPQYFPSLYVNIIRTGEATGNLKDSLSQLLNYLQRLDDLRLRVKQAMAYPIFMVLVGLGTIFVMLTFILPRIAGMFDDFQAQLPLPTRMLLGVSDFFKAYWILVIVFLAAVIFLLSRHKPGKESILSRLKYRLPIIKGLIYKQSVSNFSTSLSILLKSGVTLLAALNDAASVIGNPVYIKQLAEVRKDISEGVSFSRSLLKFKIFPSFFVQMVKVGEEGGRLDIILADIASLYEKEIESDLKVISSLIEPAIILVLGLIIGGMLIAMLLPIFNINLLVGG